MFDSFYSIHCITFQFQNISQIWCNYWCLTIHQFSRSLIPGGFSIFNSFMCASFDYYVMAIGNIIYYRQYHLLVFIFRHFSFEESEGKKYSTKKYNHTSHNLRIRSIVNSLLNQMRSHLKTKYRLLHSFASVGYKTIYKTCCQIVTQICCGKLT